MPHSVPSVAPPSQSPNFDALGTDVSWTRTMHLFSRKQILGG
jgi:hypothetical protein